ncbi:MAG: mechanosensitive ion channel family protein [Nitrosopumilus sp.]|uniref:mechanosensitive ion channel domain-containing protein n=1 Tax=Nitrosopumilus sp. TaxID=2024843 RepID=UPI00247C5CD2|nr:mechanosensitive ion channel domain-containing protein [Nitrosopumilus sp.]MCV0392701.1 mechanosensitive ion channel family protein [Nitrosopumilus sp.]
MDYQELMYVIISLIISVLAFLTIRIIINKKLSNLIGVQKLTGLFSLIIIVIEASYLGFVFGFFDLASEMIASMGLAFALFTFALFNHLKNIVSGIGLYLNPEINIGDIIQIGDAKGKISEIHLMKTIAIADDGRKIFIPNLKFSEEVSILTNK